jgi:hypothetical protein
MPQNHWSRSPELRAGLGQQAIIFSRTNNGRLVTAPTRECSRLVHARNMRQRFSMRFLQPEAVAAGPEAWHP